MAIVVKDLTFSYSTNHANKNVLDRVNFNVPKGSIYGLLGPSGCGKTTLLKCVIGLCKPNSGEVKVFGYRPRTEESGVPGAGVGYMPQELAVQLDLTIREILVYFGTILCISDNLLEEKIDFFVNAFELPDKSRLIYTLSAGQKRRLSLAIALLHEPRLLILDEPTVGVDPLLCRKIWNLLEKVTKNKGTTVVITTHYIQEARKANFVGFMRKGRIIEETSPENVIQRYATNTLESAFLTLCCIEKQQKYYSISDIEKTVENSRKEKFVIKNKHEVSEMTISMKVLTAIITKFFIETRRSPMAIVGMFLLSLLTISAVKFTLGQTPKSLPVAWVVEEPYFDVQCYNSSSFEALNELINCSMANNSSLNYSENGRTNNVIEVIYIPDLLRKHIDDVMFNLVNYTDFNTAYNDLRKKKIHGMIYFGPSYSRSYVQSDPLLDFSSEWVNTSVIDAGTIKLYLDLSSLVISKSIEISIRLSLFKFTKSVAEEYELNPKLAEPPLAIEPIYGELSEDDFFGAVESLGTGLLISTVYITGVFISVLSLLNPPEYDMFVRSYTSGVKPIHIVVGQILARIPFVFTSAAFSMFVTIYGLNIPCRGSMPLAFLILLMATLSGLAHGLFFSSFMSNSAYGLIAVFAVTNMFLFTDGILWPLEALPYYLKWTQPMMPYTYVTATFRNLVVKANAPFSTIWPGFVSVTFWIVLPLFISIFILSKKS